MRIYNFECYTTNRNEVNHFGEICKPNSILGWEINILSASAESMQEAKETIKKHPFFHCIISFDYSQETNLESGLLYEDGILIN